MIVSGVGKPHSLSDAAVGHCSRRVATLEVCGNRASWVSNESRGLKERRVEGKVHTCAIIDASRSCWSANGRNTEVIEAD